MAFFFWITDPNRRNRLYKRRIGKKAKLDKCLPSKLSPPAFPVLSLPQDVFFEITSWLSIADLKILMLSCRNFHPVVIQHLYTNIYLTGLPARICFVAVVGSSTRSSLYAKTIRRLSYGLGNDNPFLSFPVLCRALSATMFLKALEISIPAEHAMLLTNFMIRAGFTQGVQNCGTSKTLTLGTLVPHLDAFCPGASIDLLSMIRHQKLRAVCITKSMGYDELNYLFDVFNVHGKVPRMEDLRIRLRKGIDLHVVMSMIGDVFPTISTLSVEQNGMNPMVRSNHYIDITFPLTISQSDGNSDAH